MTATLNVVVSINSTTVMQTYWTTLFYKKFLFWRKYEFWKKSSFTPLEQKPYAGRTDRKIKCKPSDCFIFNNSRSVEAMGRLSPPFVFGSASFLIFKSLF